MPYCSFSNDDIPKGTGFEYVLRDGTALYFCSSKCMKNYLKLKREGRKVKWTNKEIVGLSTDKKEDKKDSALAKEIEQKLAAKSTVKPAAKK